MSKNLIPYFIGQISSFQGMNETVIVEPFFSIAYEKNSRKDSDVFLSHVWFLKNLRKNGK